MQPRSINSSQQRASYQYQRQLHQNNMSGNQGYGIQQQMQNIMEGQGGSINMNMNANQNQYYNNQPNSQQIRIGSMPININQSREFVRQNYHTQNVPISGGGTRIVSNALQYPEQNQRIQSVPVGNNMRVQYQSPQQVSYQNTGQIQVQSNRIQSPQVVPISTSSSQYYQNQSLNNNPSNIQPRPSSDNRYIVNSQPLQNQQQQDFYDRREPTGVPVNQNRIVSSSPMYHTQPLSGNYYQNNQINQFANTQPLIVHSQPPNSNLQPNQNQGFYPNQSGQFQGQNKLQKSSTHHKFSQKYIQLFEKFVWYTQRHEYFTRQIAYLNEQLDNVNNQQQWIDLKKRHGQVLARLTQIDQQLNIIALQHKDVIQSLMNNEQGFDSQPQGINEQWINNYNLLQEEYNRLKQKCQSMQGIEQGYQQLSNGFQHLQSQHANAINIIGQLQAELTNMKNQANRVVRQSADVKSAKRIDQLQQYSLEIQEYAKQCENQINNLNQQIRMYQENAGSQGSNIRNNSNPQQQPQNNIDQQQYQKLVQMIQERDSQIQSLKTMTSNKQQYDELLREKDNEIQQLKLAMDSIQMQQKQQIHEQIQELQQKIKASVVSLEKKIKDLQEDNHKKNREKEQLRSNYENQIYSLNQELSRKNNQSQKTFRELQEKIYAMEEQSRKKGNQKDQIVRELNRKITELQDQLSRKNYQVIRPLTDKNMRLQEQLNQRTIQMSKFRQGNEFLRHQAQARQLNQSIEYKNQEVALARKQKQRIQKQYDDLHREFDDIILDYNKKKAELNVLKRQAGQVSSYQAEINSLNEILHKKNQQIFQMKSNLMDSQQVRAQLAASFQSNQRLNQTIKNRNLQISTLKQNLFNLQQRLRDATQPMMMDTKNPKHLQEELDYLQQNMRKKDQQLSKMRQTLQLKDTNIEQLELEKQKLKSKFSMFQRVLEEQREQFKRRMSNTEIQCQSKVKQANEYSNQIRFSTQKQISGLRQQLNGKQNMIYQLNNNIEDLKIKINTIQRQRNQIRIEHENCSRKINDKQSMVNELRIKLGNFQNELNNRQDKMRQFKSIDGNYKQQMRKLQLKIGQLQTQIQAKDGALKSFQNQNKDLNQKQKNVQQQINKVKMKYQEELERAEQANTLLNHKAASYQHKLMNLNQFSSLDFKVKDFQCNQVFQQKIIYELKTENQRLRHELLGLGKNIPEKDTTKKRTSHKHKKGSPNKHHKSKSPRKSNKNIQNQQQKTGEINFIQKRLQDFNQRLEQLILENRQNQLQGSAHYQQHKYANSRYKDNRELTQQVWQKLQQDRQTLIEKHTQQITQMKTKVTDLQKYVQILELKLRQGNISFYNLNGNLNTYGQSSSNSQQAIKSNKKISSQEQAVYTQQINFYKQKNKELQQRVNQLITVNTDLKTRVQGMMKSGGGNFSVSYLKDQIHSLQTTVQNLNARIVRLTQQNKQVRNQVNNKRSTLVQNSDNKIFQLETIVQDLNRKISQVTIEKKMIQNEKNSLMIEFDKLSSQLFKERTNSNQRVSQSTVVVQSNLRNAQQKISEYQMEITKLSNKIAIFEAENQRLNQMFTTKGNDSSIQVTRLKQRLSQMQQQCRRLENIIETKDRQRFRIDSEMNNIVSKLSFYEKELNRLNDSQHSRNQNEATEISRLTMIIRQHEITIKKLNYQISTIQFELNSLKTSSENEYSRIVQNYKHLEFEYNKILNQYNRLKNEGSNSSGQIMKLRQMIKNIQYTLQLLRSNYLQIDAIFGQLKLKDNQQINLAQRFRANVQRGLTLCSELSLVIDT